MTKRSSIEGDLVMVKVGENFCPACVASKPKFEALSERHPNFNFYDVRISEYQDNTFEDLELMPTIYFIINGKVRRRIVGYNESKLIRYMNRYERRYEVKKHIDVDEYRNHTRKKYRNRGKKSRHHK